MEEKLRKRYGISMLVTNLISLIMLMCSRYSVDIPDTVRAVLIIAGVFGAVIMIYTYVKMLKFRKDQKDLRDDTSQTGRV